MDPLQVRFSQKSMNVCIKCVFFLLDRPMSKNGDSKIIGHHLWIFPKGQMKSECIYEIINFPKIDDFINTF